MAADYTLRCVLLLAALAAVSCQSVPQSPCPGVFKYELPGSESGRWYGVVTLTTDITLHGIWLNVVLDGKADILGNWAGEVTTTDNMDFKIENTTLKLYPDRALAVRFFIQYNQYGKVPRVSAIRLNGREICSSNTGGVTSRPAYDAVRQDDVRPTRDETTNRVEARPIREEISTSRVDVRPIREEILPIRNEKPSRDPDVRPVYVASDNAGIGQNPNAYSIIGDISAQELGSDKKRPSITSSSTQTRPADQNSVAGDRNRPTNQDRPSYDQDRPTYDQDRPTADQTRPTYDQSRPTATRKPQRTRPGQTTDFQDYTEDNGTPSESDYFTGGLPSLHAVLSSIPRPTPTASSYNDEQCGKPVRGATPLIVNGRQTLEGQWPWQIALYQTQTVDSKYICGGTLISRSHVVTAAHCVTLKGSSQIVNRNTFTIYLGKHNLRTSVDGVQIRFIGGITLHPNYNASVYSRDAAVLRLREPADVTDYVRPVCLWPEDRIELSNVVGKRGTVVGWGFDDKGLATEELHLVEMPVVEQETCIRSYSEFFVRFTSEYTYCAGFRDGRSVCNGDSGGGMVFKLGDRWHLRGLVSLSSARQNDARCDTSHYVIFTDLAKFLPWLRQVISGDY